MLIIPHYRSMSITIFWVILGVQISWVILGGVVVTRGCNVYYMVILSYATLVSSVNWFKDDKSFGGI